MKKGKNQFNPIHHPQQNLGKLVSSPLFPNQILLPAYLALGFDRCGHTNTNTNTDMIIPIYSKLIPIHILPSRIYIKPIPISVMKLG